MFAVREFSFRHIENTQKGACWQGSSLYLHKAKQKIEVQFFLIFHEVMEALLKLQTFTRCGIVTCVFGYMALTPCGIVTRVFGYMALTPFGKVTRVFWYLASTHCAIVTRVFWSIYFAGALAESCTWEKGLNPPSVFVLISKYALMLSVTAKIVTHAVLSRGSVKDPHSWPSCVG